MLDRYNGFGVVEERKISSTEVEKSTDPYAFGKKTDPYAGYIVDWHNKF